MSTEYSKVCHAGFFAAGLQPWEDVQSVFRVVCTLVTVSIFSSWFSRRGIGRLMLLFLHWVGGLVHLLSGIVMAEMVLDCWVGAELVTFIKALKFLELAGSNLVAVTNLAICANLALIVHSHRTMTRIKSLSSLRMVLFFLTLSVGSAASAVPYWERWLMSGTAFHMGGTTTATNDWIIVSYFLLEAVVSVFMTIIVLLLLLFRRSELRQVWRLHRRIKYHVALTVIALLVNLAITVSGFLILFDGGPFWLIIISWILRYVHIALDTLVLYSALETPVFHLPANSNFQDSNGNSIHPHSVLRY